VNAFSRLSESSLIELIEAIEKQRLTRGNRLLLARHLPSVEAEAVGAEIDRLIDEGLSQSHLLYLLRTLLSGRQLEASGVPKVDLVWTGPGGSGTSNRDTAVVVRELFASATRSVLIAGFAVHHGREIFKQLAFRMTERPQLEVRMFLNIARALRDTTITEQLIGRFVNEFRREHWSGTRYPVIYYDPRALAIDEKKRTSLHAKCIVVDGAISLVTSANFTEAAQQRNVEVGALVTDEQFSKALVEQFDGMIRAGAVQRLPLG
jgi:phosphatidylserine/phosphatidylglycerophosphate/cardiolipin synthase-like enzyme